MADSLVKVRIDVPAGTIVLNHPPSGNALSRAMIAALRQALDDLHRQRQVRAVILTAAGDAFCSGSDLYEKHEASKGEDALARWHEDAVQYRDLLDAMLQFPKPILAAVQGPAMGGGAGLAVASDVVLAAPEARFGLPDPRQGLVSGIAAPLLVFRIGGSHAAQLLLTARTIDAAEAYRIGLAHEIVAADLLWARAMEVARECALSAPQATALTKRMLNETIGEHLTTLLAAGAAVTATSHTTEAAAEGLSAYVEKRRPDWP